MNIEDRIQGAAARDLYTQAAKPSRHESADSGLRGPIAHRDGTTKGLQLEPGESVELASLAGRGWNAVKGDLDLPALVVHRDALAHNIAAMSDYCRQFGVLLAPHAKTSMSPEITQRQLDAGAWAITAATPGQVRTLHAFGVRRILLANVLVDRGAINWVVKHILSDPDARFICYVDSFEGIDLLEAHLRAAGDAPPVHVLVELGYAGGRTGARSVEEAVLLARRVAASPYLSLDGVAAFEGLVPGSGKVALPVGVRAFLDRVHKLVDRLHDEDLFGASVPVVSAGGSSYFDIVIEELGPEAFSFPVRVVLRSGCYVTHDHGTYADSSPLATRGGAGADGRRLLPALELLASVWSRPEADLVIAGFGRRDVPTDERMPVVLRRHGSFEPVDGFRVTAVNDQHAFIRIPITSDLQVGDVLGLGISHPCGAFDRWQFVPEVDPEYSVISGLNTYF